MNSKLSAILTLAMARLGKGVGNLMMDMLPGNAKLRARAGRIVRGLTAMGAVAAEAALARSGRDLKAAGC